MKFIRVILLTGITAGVQAEPLQFNRDIRPILSDRCFACHAADAPETRCSSTRNARTGAAATEAVAMPTGSADTTAQAAATSIEPEAQPA